MRHTLYGEILDVQDKAVRESAELALNNVILNEPHIRHINLVIGKWEFYAERETGVHYAWFCRILKTPPVEPTFRDGFLLNAEERYLIGQGEIIPAIRSLRERLKISLMNSKDHVDLFRKHYNYVPMQRMNVCVNHKFVGGGVCRRCGHKSY